MFQKILARVQWCITQFFLSLIWFYQKTISPFMGQRCRFYPSCSEYAKQSLKTHFILFALWLVSKRLLKCQPLHPGGYDPVPLKKQKE